MKKVKLIVNASNRISAIKELREITGMGLKQAIDTVGSEYNGKEITVNMIVNRDYFENFKLVDEYPPVNQEGIKRIIAMAIEVDEYDIAVDLLNTLKARMRKI